MTEEEAEEECIGTDEEEPAMTPRNRFRYTAKTFGHSPAPFRLHRSQFGHKQLTRYFNDPHASTRAIVRTLSRNHENLLDPPKHPPRKWLLYLVFGLAAATAVMSFFKPAQSDLTKIMSATEIIDDRISTLANLLRRPDISRPLLASSFEKVGSLLNQSDAAELTLKAMSDAGIVPLIWSFLKSEASLCRATSSQYLIILAVALLQDTALAGGELSVNGPIAGKLFQRCYEYESVIGELFQLLAVALQIPRAAPGLHGIPKLIVATLEKEEFGPWVIPPMGFFAMWARERKLLDADMKAVCRFLEYALANEQRWKRQHYALLCMLAEGVKCPCMETEEFQRIHRNADCQDVMRQFEARGDL
jgi:hypothetical protein